MTYRPSAMQSEGKVYPGFKPVAFTDGRTNIFRAIVVGLEQGIYTFHIELELESDLSSAEDHEVLATPISFLFSQQERDKPIGDPKHRVTYLDEGRFETIAYDDINPFFRRPVSPSTTKPNVGTAGADVRPGRRRSPCGRFRARQVNRTHEDLDSWRPTGTSPEVR